MRKKLYIHKIVRINEKFFLTNLNFFLKNKKKQDAMENLSNLNSEKRKGKVMN